MHVLLSALTSSCSIAPVALQNIVTLYSNDIVSVNDVLDSL